MAKLVSRIGRGLLWSLINFDALLVLIVAATAAALHLTHHGEADLVQGITLAVLALLGFSILHDRVHRERFKPVRQSLTELVTAVDVVSRKISKAPADTFFSRATSESSIIASTEDDLLAVQETGTLLLETNKNAVVRLLNAGRRVRAVLAFPGKSTAALLAFRNANLTRDAIVNRATLARAHLQDICDQVGKNAERIEVRFLPYPMGMTCVISDPEHAVLGKRKAIVRPAGFMVTYCDKLDYEVDALTSPAVFASKFAEAKRLFEHSSKVVLLTGAPRSGKTRLLEALATGAGHSAALFHVLSQANMERSKRLGFTVRTSAGLEQPFANRSDDQPTPYSVAEGVWEEVAEQLNDAMRDRKVIILDEIGPMQLKSQTFVDFVRKALDDPSITLFASVALDDNAHPLIPIVKRHWRASVHTLDSERARETLLSILSSELMTSLRLYNSADLNFWQV